MQQNMNSAVNRAAADAALMVNRATSRDAMTPPSESGKPDATILVWSQRLPDHGWRGSISIPTRSGRITLHTVVPSGSLRALVNGQFEAISGDDDEIGFAFLAPLLSAALPALMPAVTGAITNALGSGGSAPAAGGGAGGILGGLGNMLGGALGGVLGGGGHAAAPASGASAPAAPSGPLGMLGGMLGGLTGGGGGASGGGGLPGLSGMLGGLLPTGGGGGLPGLPGLPNPMAMLSGLMPGGGGGMMGGLPNPMAMLGGLFGGGGGLPPLPHQMLGLHLPGMEMLDQAHAMLGRMPGMPGAGAGLGPMMPTMQLPDGRQARMRPDEFANRVPGILGAGSLLSRADELADAWHEIAPSVAGLLRKALRTVDAEAGNLMSDPAARATLQSARQRTEARVANALKVAEGLIGIT